MNEIERIKRKWNFNKDFFEVQKKCDYVISEDMKKVWAICLDLIFEFDVFCEKYSLSYYLFFGSLLGAIRHNGFIPWDDDIDLVMPREDFEIIEKEE